VKVRIRHDRYLGYEVQVRKRWLLIFPYWAQAGGVNTFSTVEEAEEYARRFKVGFLVKYV